MVLNDLKGWGICFWRLQSNLLEVTVIPAYSVLEVLNSFRNFGPFCWCVSHEDVQAGSLPLRSFRTFFFRKMFRIVCNLCLKNILFLENNCFSFKAPTYCTEKSRKETLFCTEKSRKENIFYRGSSKNTKYDANPR